MRIRATLTMELNLEEEDVKALKNASPQDVLSTAQLHGAKVKTSIERIKREKKAKREKPVELKPKKSTKEG